jgi:hypothetical protein
LEEYSSENELNDHFQLIQACMENAKKNYRREIILTDITLAIIDIHDKSYPSYDNGAWVDKHFHTPYNTISHVIGIYSKYLWVKNDDIRWELENIDKKDYDLAISFAGEDREIAKEIAGELSKQGIGVFYDNFERANLWGKNLYTHFNAVYGEKAKYCLMIVSKHYAQKNWTNLERQIAQAKAFREKKEYILPLRLDDTEIPGLLPTIGYIDIRQTNINEVVKLIIEKIGKTF